MPPRSIVEAHPPRPRLARFAALAVATGLVTGACSSSTSSSSAPSAAASASTAVSNGGPTTAKAAGAATGATSTAASTGPTSTGPASTGAGAVPDAFYTPPTPLPDGNPGDLIRSQPFAASAGSKGYAILYRSTAVDGTPTAVSGIVYVPDAPVSGARDVLAWAHGTTGLGDQCATSKQFESGTASEEAIASFATQQGYVFVATDYQGLGTPGPHPYLVNQAEGRNVLDAIRAAQRLPQSGATDASRAVVWGHSQGGGAASFAAELKPTYAPELKLLGAVAGAPAADFAGTLAGAAASAGPNFGFAVMAVAGFAAAYPDVSEATLLTDKGRQVAARIQGECSDAILSELAATSPGELLQPAVATDAALAARLKENSAGYLKTDVPIWLYHGDADTTVPPSASKNMLDRYCAEGVNAARKVYPGADHTSVVLSAAADILTWIQARFRGQPAVSSC